MVSCKVVAGDHQTPLIDAYLTTSNLEQLTDLEEALNRLQGREPVVLGGQNAEIVRLRNPWDQHVADFLAYFGLVDLLGHFRQLLSYHHLQTWWQVRQV